MPNEIDLRYPIGKVKDQLFSDKGSNDERAKAAHILDIQQCPNLLEAAISNLDEHQLNVPYREGGWTSKQVIHHVADSHMNAFIRFKLGLTEDNPAIRPYMEAAWAELPDTKNCPINISLTLLHSLHLRLYELLKNLSEADWNKTIFHPQQERTMTLWNLLEIYSWHGRHHVAHITSLRDRMNWR